MISIFEVFAINRNEDDFLENLALFAQLVMAQDEEQEDEEEEEDSKEDIKEPVEDLSDPRIKSLSEVKSQLTTEEYEYCKAVALANGPLVNTTINVY
jgi:hypothetical protein